MYLAKCALHFGYLLVTEIMKVQPDTQNVITEDVMMKVPATSHGHYYKPSLVHIAFLFVFDKLNKLLQSYDVKKLIRQCENTIACEQENSKLFSNDQIDKLSKCNSTLSLLRSLSFTWSNHSILRMLLTELSSEALELLDEFNSRVDPLHSISSYPIPCFSSDMIPADTSTHTILAIRCYQELYESTLQYVFDMQSLMMEKCNITQHCLQLLAVRSDPTILYWTIPKCVVQVVNTNVSLHSEYLYSRGILEVLVYPDLQLIVGDHVSVGSLAFSDDSKLVEIKVHTYVVTVLICNHVVELEIKIRNWSVIYIS